VKKKEKKLKEKEKADNDWIDCLDDLALSDEDNKMSEEEENKPFGLKKKIKKNKKLKKKPKKD
jgi:hypothetical protein